MLEISITTRAADRCFKSIIDNLKPEVTEVMTHPGYCDEELTQISSYNDGRNMEARILTDEKIRQYVKQRGIVLTNYSIFEEGHYE